jgi:hypothetical protein
MISFSKQLKYITSLGYSQQCKRLLLSLKHARFAQQARSQTNLERNNEPTRRFL